MNRRHGGRINFSQNITNNSLPTPASYDSINSEQLTQFSCLLTAFRNEIFQRLDENNRQMRRFIAETKQEIFKKINKSGKDYKWSQNKLKNDIIKNIDNLKTFADGSGFNRSDTIENYLNEETNSNTADNISVRSEPSRSVNDGGELHTFPNEEDLLNDEDLGLPDKSLDILEAELDRKRGNRHQPLNILSVVADKVDTLCKRLSLVSDVSNISIFKTDEKVESNAGKTASSKMLPNTRDLEVELGVGKEIVNNVFVKTVEGSDLKTNKGLETNNEQEGCSQVGLDHRKKSTEDSMVKTGAIKKILNDSRGKDLEVAASLTQEMDDEEMEEVVGKLANVLDVQYDRQNVRIICRQNSIVIKFRNEEEFEKWRGAARQIVEKEKFSYQELLDLEEVDVIYNIEKFECPICLMDCDVGKGITLRDCLHSFCRQCIIQTVEHNTEMEIKCPFRDNDYTCPSVIQHREIKEVVPKELYDQYLDKTFTIVGNRLGNTVHCKTPDCRNFYICEDEVSSFYCDSCKSINCVPCKAVHTGMNCKQYQDELRIMSESDPKARETLRMIERMIEAKEAIPCPQCLVIVMKTEGCDWIQCSMCKTEICWATLGPRWGPEGRGDTSGGCKCKLNGSPCHVNCKNCH